MRRPALVLVAVWLAGANLRAAIFGVQPVLPDIRRELGLGFAATGGLTSLAIAVLGLGSIPGAFFAWLLGARRAVTVTSVGIGMAALARLLPAATWMFAGTALLSLCVSLAQPSVAVLLRRWFAGGLERASGVYSNGLLVGGTTGAAATPLIAAAVGWRGSFVVWGGVAIATALTWRLVTPDDQARLPRLRVRDALTSGRAWQVTALFTFQNFAYFGAAAWLPFLLAGSGSAYVAWVFLCLNLLPVVPLLILPALPWPYVTSPAFYLLGGLVTVAGAAGLALGLRDAAWLFAFLLGLGCAATFVGSMALPPMVARTETEAAGITAVVFTFGYLLAFSSALVAGLLVERTHDVTTAFWPSLAGGVAMAAAGLLVTLRIR